MKRVTALALYVLLYCRMSASRDEAGQENDCTSGFMSLERIHALLDNTSFRVLTSSQVLIPGINFTCSGNIHKWTFGAEWYGNTESYTELQIWRSSGNGSYTKVGSTPIKADNNPTEFYEYPLFAPLSFQEGDIFGYYQPSASMSQLGLQLEQEYGHRLYMDSKNSSASDLSLEEFGGYSHEYQVLINVGTYPPGCGHGFMSVERMRVLLGLDSVGNEVTNNGRQQITPDMKFTCDGIITKWIIGAHLSKESDNTLYPELQLWREIGNDTYQKINGTLITIETESNDGVYEYDNFPPIPFQAGDILGVFVPPVNDSRLTFKSEKERGLTNYYIHTGYNVTMSPYKTIDLHQITPSVQSSVYHPLVTVEIKSASATRPSVVISLATTTTTVAFQLPTSPSMAVSPMSSSPPVTLSPSTQVHSTDEVDATLYVVIGVCGAVVVVLIATAAIGIICLRKRQSKLRNKTDAVDITENVAYGTKMEMSCNVAYGVNQNEMEMSCNVAYATNKNEMEMSGNVAYGMNQNGMEMSGNVAYDATKRGSFQGEDTYDYISTTDGNGIIITSPNEAYATTGNGHTQAYGMVHH